MIPKVFVCTPIYGSVPFEASDAYTHMMVWSTIQKLVTGVCQSGHGVLSHARNNMISEALRTDCTHVLLMDSDMVPKRDSLARLLVEDLDIVSGLYFMRQRPHIPVMTKALPPKRGLADSQALSANAYVTDYPENAIIKVGGIGMGFALIKRHVFERIKEKFQDEKWFSFENNEGEDFWFCRRAAELGIPCHVSTGVEIGHVANVIITSEDFKLHYKATK